MADDPLTRLRDDIAQTLIQCASPFTFAQAEDVAAMLERKYPGMVAALRAEHAEQEESRARIRGMVADVQARGEGTQ